MRGSVEDFNEQMEKISEMGLVLLVGVVGAGSYFVARAAALGLAVAASVPPGLLIVAILVGGALQRVTGMGFGLVAGPFIVLVVGPLEGVVDDRVHSDELLGDGEKETDREHRPQLGAQQAPQRPPERESSSPAEPVPIQNPSAADRTESIRSVTTRTPESSGRVTRYPPRRCATPDTSVVLPLLAPWHELHEAARRTLTHGDPARALVAHVAHDAHDVRRVLPEAALPHAHRPADGILVAPQEPGGRPADEQYLGIRGGDVAPADDRDLHRLQVPGRDLSDGDGRLVLR